jgi:hypothetical protein
MYIGAGLNCKSAIMRDSATSELLVISNESLGRVNQIYVPLAPGKFIERRLPDFAKAYLLCN